MMRRDDYRRLALELSKLAEQHYFDESFRRVAPELSVEDLMLGWHTDPPEEAVSVEHVISELREYFLPGATMITSPRFLGYVLTRPAPETHAFDLLANATHSSPGAAELAPSATFLEREVLQWLATRLGIAEFRGMFTTGGCESLVVALKGARDRIVSRDEGVNGRKGPLRVYTSDEAHYCVARAWDVVGCGRANVVVYESGNLDQLNERVEADRRAGYCPVALVAGLGTTPTGRIELTPALVALARSQGLWLHADGAYGAAALMMAEYDGLRALARDTDSLSIDPHKWLSMPMGTGIVFYAPTHSFEDSFSFSSEISSARTFAVDLPDQCQMGIQGTRALHGLRVWGGIRLLGFAEIERRIRRSCEVARYLAHRVLATPQLELLEQPELSIVVFRPRGFGETRLRWLCEELIRRDQFFLTAMPVRSSWYLRVAIIAAETSERDMDELVEDVVGLWSTAESGTP